MRVGNVTQNAQMFQRDHFSAKQSFQESNITNSKLATRKKT